jgi:hypothetical protein
LFWLGWMGKGLTYLLAFNIRSFTMIRFVHTLRCTDSGLSSKHPNIAPNLCPGSPTRPRVQRICCYPLTPFPGGYRPGQHSRRSARYPAPSRSRVCSLSSCGFGCFLALHASSCVKALSVAHKGNRRA